MSADEHELILQAVEGDSIALQKLLVSRASALKRYADRNLPALLREQIDADDVVQQTYIAAIRSISRFRPEAADSLQAWLLGIADHVIKDAVKHHQRAKRGGNFRRARRGRGTGSQSMADLVELLSTGHRSPSQSIMGHEAIQALKESIRELPTDYRDAVQLRLLDGKSLEETAVIMQRSPRAVQGLLDRARKKMRAALGRLSKYG